MSSPARSSRSGFIFVQENLILVLFGGDYVNVPTVLSNRNLVVPPLVMPWPLLVGSAFAAVLAIALYVVLMRTDFGRQIRAIAQNRDAAALMGIRIGRIQAIAFGVGIGLLGFTGPLIVAQFTLMPTMGLDLTLDGPNRHGDRRARQLPRLDDRRSNHRRC